jgi:RluA family pseudouridine synthase
VTGLTVLAEDPRLVALAKPPGAVVVPARGADDGSSLRGALERRLGARVWVVHRLDRDTSGVVLFARDPDSHRSLSLAFERRAVAKTYLAYTAGAPETQTGRIDLPLHAARRGKSRPAVPGEPGSRAAATRYRVLATWSLPGVRAIAKLALEPETGRHHQLRVHLRWLGCPILFDPLYSGAAELGAAAVAAALPPAAPWRRLALHAARLVVPDPGTGLPRSFEAPLPDDLAALEAWLRDPATGAVPGLEPSGVR